MEKQFAASEVRRLSNRIPRSNDEIADAQEALRAFADLLAAREKAVPVAWMHFYRKNGGGTRMWFPTLVPKAEPQDGYEWVETRPLRENIHQTPADAERLADAQNGKWPTDANVEAAVSAFYRNDYLPDFDAMKLALLAAREKAVPVATCGHSSTVEHRASNANVVGSNPIARSNSDAERLAEALRELTLQWRSANPHGTDKPMTVGAKIAYTWCAEQIEELLANHSAQAQPPYELDPAITEKWENGELGRSLEHAQVAQPPAASVTEALLRDWFNLLCHAGIDAREEKANNTLHRIMDIAKQVSSEIAKYENAALAAQENK